MAAPRWFTYLCSICLLAGVCLASDDKTDYTPYKHDDYRDYNSPFPFEMRPPFASAPSGRSRHPNEIFEHPKYRPAAQYVPYPRPRYPYHGYDGPRPEPYSPPVYVPRGHARPEPVPHADPFLEVHQRVNAQFEPEHAPPPPPAAHYPPPPPEVYLRPLPAVYHAPPPPPPPAYHEPRPYAHRFPYSEDEPKEHSSSRQPKSLNPAPFIAAIANAYQENEKNFGVNRQGKLEHPVGHPRPVHLRPEHPRPEHAGFREHPLFERVRPTLRYAPPQLPGPLYSLATAGSELTASTVQPDGMAADSGEMGQEA
ncbi:hypothetical protein FJT64_007977 [Amphibalanus amphitrite]|uniref:Uncharacterized protein n=1 Tax=Amphibalanus amphitrite TaxID=1232801 RepID=A0A6A4VSE3_AMPAM|nr:hypothetical protein FJT64_007977 [Amphibalanus amphitrite]